MPSKTIQNTFFFALLLLATLAFLGLIQDFMQPIFWAVVLATLFYPVHLRWLRVCKERSSLAAVLSILSIILLIILPLFLVGLAVSRESVALYQRIASGEIDLQAPLEYIDQVAPVLVDYMDEFGINSEKIMQNLSDAAVTVSQFLASRALQIGQDTLRITALFFLMLYVLFFFLRDGEKLLDVIVRALPLGDERERRLFSKFAQVSRATIKGTLVVGFVQGALGGLLFWILGIAAPVFWGVIMTVLSLLPAVGAAIVWLPAAIILLVTGKIAQGLILIAAGTLVIGLADNVLRPILVGRDTQMPDFLILLSTLGGLAVFGLSGFVIGPIIAALFLVVWDMFQEEYASETDLEVIKEGITSRADEG